MRRGRYTTPLPEHNATFGHCSVITRGPVEVCDDFGVGFLVSDFDDGEIFGAGQSLEALGVDAVSSAVEGAAGGDAEQA